MALKLQRKIRHPLTLPVSTTEIALGCCVKLSSSKLVVTGANEAFVGITTEIGYASKDVLLAGVGSIVFCLAHDNAIAENEWLVPAAAGRVDGIAATTTTIQYTVGIALMAASAQDQLIPVLVLPGVVVGTQSV